MRPLRKRSQSELLGIVIVVLLASFGLLFAFKLGSGKVEEPKKKFEERQLAANTLGALLRATTDCNYEKMGSLIADCGSVQSIRCGSMSSCDYLQQQIAAVFTETLDKWEKNYTFKLYKMSGDIIAPISNGNCQEYQESQTQPFPVYGDIIYITLNLCQK